jgi:hypothetical protein
MTSWLVLQKSKSKYQDVEGLSYEYPSHISHAKKIGEGDYLVCTLPKKSSKGGRRIFGIGRVDKIENYEREGKPYLRANYGWYRDFSKPYTFSEVGGDPREKPNTIQSIAPISQSKESDLLELLLGEIAEDFEVVEKEWEMDDLVVRSPVPISPSRTKRSESEMLKEWIVEALKSYGGAATMIDISKWIWEEYEQEMRGNGDMFYRWQYAMRWAGTSLRKDGVLQPVDHSDRGIWILS